VEAAPETEALVRALVADITGRPVRAVARMAYGHGSVTYRVDTDGGATIIVRTNPDPDIYAGTIANLDTLRGLGLPVPSMLHADLTLLSYPFAYVVTDAFPGRDLGFELARMTAAQMTRLAEQISGFERQVSRLPPGYGYGFMPIGAAGGHGRWIDAVRADRPLILAPGDVGGDAGGDVTGDLNAGPSGDAGRDVGCGARGDAAVADLFVDVRSAVDQSAARLDLTEPICFLDDLTTKNVIVYGGVLQGVVDFDVVCYGDPMYWLALTQVAILFDVGAAGQFYVDELTRLWAPSSFELANLALYSALHAAEFLSWPDDDRADGAPARRQRVMTAARSWLAAV
jgi:aminoglycoside phosphotransferase